MQIRTATPSDIPYVQAIYDEARRFMRQSGNQSQWQGGYPHDAVIRADIEKGQLYLVIEDESILGAFVYFLGEEPTYRYIEDGEWLAPSRPYGVLHRVAVSASAHGRGVGARIFRYAIEQAGNVRIDTHEDNAPMRHSLQKHGFSQRGIIYLENGDRRLAYQYVV